MGLKAFIFDWDGVIVDSSELHRSSWEALANELKKELPEDHFEKGFGKRNETIIPEILRWTTDLKSIKQWGERKEEIYREFGKSGGINLQTGALRFLKQARKFSIPCCIGTSTERKNVLLAMKQHQLEEFFLDIVSSEDVSSGKPNPEVFLKASKLLGNHPSECIVFEDSPHGIKAAKLGGMKAVALTTSHPREAFHSLCPDLLVPNLNDLKMDNLQAIFQ